MPNPSQENSMIDLVDLRTVIERLVLIENWKENEAHLAAEQYRKYLHLKKKYGNEYELPPSDEIDEVWHAHILHTLEYVTFCDAAFGHYLHHHPHRRDGELTDEQIVGLFDSQTQKLYFQEFGEYIYSVRKPSLIKRVSTIFKRLGVLIKNPSAVNAKY